MYVLSGGSIQATLLNGSGGVSKYIHTQEFNDISELVLPIVQNYEKWLITRKNARHSLHQDPGIWQFWQYFLILLFNSYVKRTPNIAKIAKSPSHAATLSNAMFDQFDHGVRLTNLKNQIFPYDLIVIIGTPNIQSMLIQFILVYGTCVNIKIRLIHLHFHFTRALLLFSR